MTSLRGLSSIKSPLPPRGYLAYWDDAYNESLLVPREYALSKLPLDKYNPSKWDVHYLTYLSTNGFTCKGWVLVPKQTTGTEHTITNVKLILHGYGGREHPDLSIPCDNHTVIFFPCVRGLGESKVNWISSNPYYHVIHDIQDKNEYIIKGCVQDVWCCVNIISKMYTGLPVSVYGESLGGALGIMAMMKENLLERGVFKVPAFGNHLERLRNPCEGSSLSLQHFYEREPFKLVRTLRYFDSSIAVQFIKDKPSKRVDFEVAMIDNVVVPETQWSIYNSCTLEKGLEIIEVGHI